MADIKWSAFPSTAAGAASGDTLVGLHSADNYQFTLSPTAVALSVMQRDANNNASTNNFLSGYTTTATAAGTTVLTVSSAYKQYFTGSTTQTVTLPVTSTLTLGFSFLIVNLSSGVVTVQSSGGNSIQAMASGTALLVTCILTSGTGTASWSAQYSSGGGGGVSSGTINELAWYSATGNTVSGLATANNGILVTSAGGVPSIGNSVNADLLIHSITVGRGNSSIATNTVVGNGAGASYTSGNHNSSIGWSSLDAVTTGSNNTAYGYLSGVSGATGAVTLTTGSSNTFLGYRAASNATDAEGTIAIGADAVAPKSTGITSGDNGPGIAFGSDALRVGFTGDGTIYSGGTGRGYWRPTINGAQYLMPLFIDGTLTASASMVTDANGSPILSSAMTNGQIVIGSTGATPAAGTLTAGTGISITNGAASITINSTGGGLATATIAGTSDTAVVNTQYIALNAGQTTVTLPATFAVGDVVRLVGATANTGGWILTAATGDTIRVNNSTTSAGGTVTCSAVAGQTIEVVCDVANTSWVMTATASVTLTTA